MSGAMFVLNAQQQTLADAFKGSAWLQPKIFASRRRMAKNHFLDSIFHEALFYIHKAQ
jgi:hypothetical protein